mmetsp:Transcript_19781/g.46274  ORF Transcript_19781/g.46274 Transcript_19781/m.46274 type:complete len:180 (-) Transcript_19781:171-710(-)
MVDPPGRSRSDGGGQDRRPRDRRIAPPRRLRILRRKRQHDVQHPLVHRHPEKHRLDCLNIAIRKEIARKFLIGTRQLEDETRAHAQKTTITTTAATRFSSATTIVARSIDRDERAHPFHEKTNEPTTHEDAAQQQSIHTHTQKHRQIAHENNMTKNVHMLEKKRTNYTGGCTAQQQSIH